MSATNEFNFKLGERLVWCKKDEYDPREGTISERYIDDEGRVGYRANGVLVYADEVM